MRWGVPEQAADNHSTTDLCIQEIKKCQEVSVGPNFVVREKSTRSVTIALTAPMRSVLDVFQPELDCNFNTCVL